MYRAWALDRFEFVRAALPALRIAAAHPVPVAAFAAAAVSGGSTIELVAIVAASITVERLALYTGRWGVEGSALHELARDLRGYKDLGVHALTDYFPHGLPDATWGSNLPPYVLVIRTSSKPAASTAPMTHDRALVVTGYKPGLEFDRPAQIFVLLHELGHVGRRGRDIAASLLAFVLRALGGAGLAIACLPAHSWIGLLVLVATAMAAAAPSTGWTKLQEEVAADWFALVAFVGLARAGDPRVTNFAGPGLTVLPFKAPRDRTVGDEISQQLRVEIFEEMRAVLSTGASLNGPAWWMAEARSRDIGGMDAIFLVVALAAAALSAATLSGSPVVTPWLAAAPLSLSAVACVFHLYKGFNAAACEKALAERAPGALGQAVQRMEAHRRAVLTRSIFARVVDGLGRREMYRAEAETSEGDVGRQVRESLDKLALGPLRPDPPDRP